MAEIKLGRVKGWVRSAIVDTKPNMLPIAVP